MEDSLRRRREALGLTALEMAALAGCAVEVVLRAEFGLEVPRPPALARLARAYCTTPDEYLRHALDAAERGTAAD
ncbi:MAG: helix-turn-helix transcriptional regulator [Planctomycetes bacterium]|nr:helix-turn-helix transcriptional regulator [Planctomycetota bacterium]